MQRSTTWFVLSFIIILFSAPIAYFLFANIFFHNLNLSSGEAYTLLYCTLLSLFMIGIMMFVVGLTEMKSKR